MKKPISWLANGLLLALMALVPAATSSSDDQAGADKIPLTTGKIIVTSQFIEQRLQGTPQAITVMPAQLFEATSQNNMLDLDAVVGAAVNVVNLGLATAVVGRPREWSVSIKRHF